MRSHLCRKNGSSPRMWGTHRFTRGNVENGRFIPTDVGNAQSQAQRKNTDTVHPHGCGERNTTTTANGIKTGSSPRMWGTLLTSCYCFNDSRFIPTDVGNAPEATRMSRPTTVHPHGCGERFDAKRFELVESGSSPRMWGTPREKQVQCKPRRFIPTDVGNAISYFNVYYISTVHPHGCGERTVDTAETKGRIGSSPRMWGTPSKQQHY